MLSMRSCTFSCALLLLGSILPVGAQPKEKPKWAPSPHVAATDPLRPEEQLKKLKVPPGFEIQLVAGDPDIRKPINIAFDAQGRLWVTETIEYPFAAKEGQGRDAVKILEDFGPDGRARKITTFVDKLNIPIGVLPTADGKGALVYSIPAISRMIDTKGLGKADVRETLYSGFGFDDTHGMTGEFQQGFDGWIYACHGFRNTSKVQNKDGKSAIAMTSGNTYRIKPDGSRIEHFTYGQVNPFGIGIDPYGNLFTGDCHSRPLTMLLRGALYEHFGNKHDGLGFAPHMNTFKNHSTALCGVTYYAADQFPPEYQGKLFLGDVVLNRVNAYGLQWTGASPSAIMEDFITSQDPWFRPVDIKLGPDGCLYIADFYNRIIGHYEVDLKHPGRDRDKGRIWRVVYRGADGNSGPKPVTNLARADTKTLVETLAHPNLAVRLHAADQLVERGGKEAVDSLTALVRDFGENGNVVPKGHALWVLARLDKLEDSAVERALAAKHPLARVHALRILTEKKPWTPKDFSLVEARLADGNSFVQRVAVEAVAAHPASSNLSGLIALRQRVPAGDNHLLHAVRLALREHLRDDKVLRELANPRWTPDDHLALVDVAVAIKSEAAAEYLKSALPRIPENADRTRTLVHHIVRHGGEGATAWAIELANKDYAKDRGKQGALIKTILQANQERGGKLGESDRSKSEAVVIRLLESADPGDKQLGAELAAPLKLVKTRPHLLALVSDAGVPEGLRKQCVATLVILDAQEAIPPLARMLLNEKEAIAVREQIASALAGANHPDAHAALLKALQNTPARLQTTVALGMASSPQGGDRLLQAIEAGKASPRLLQDAGISFRLSQAKIPNVKDRLQTLRKSLPPDNQKAQELIVKKRDAFATAPGAPDLGQKVFQKSCANCHQIASQGAKIGPQLDGIGIRGLERLLEDVLDPNRNVDQAFRTTIVTTKLGQTISGLFLREEGNVLLLADTQGKEVRVEKAMVEERILSPLSPMPGNFAETISDADFRHLLAYLLAQRGKSEK